MLKLFHTLTMGVFRACVHLSVASKCPLKWVKCIEFKLYLIFFKSPLSKDFGYFYFLSSLIDFELNFSNTRWDFSTLKCIENFFMASQLLHFGKCSIGTGSKCAFCIYGMINSDKTAGQIHRASSYVTSRQAPPPSPW